MGQMLPPFFIWDWRKTVLSFLSWCEAYKEYKTWQVSYEEDSQLKLDWMRLLGTAPWSWHLLEEQPCSVPAVTAAAISRSNVCITVPGSGWELPR